METLWTQIFDTLTQTINGVPLSLLVFISVEILKRVFPSLKGNYTVMAAFLISFLWALLYLADSIDFSSINFWADWIVLGTVLGGAATIFYDKIVDLIQRKSFSI